MAERKPPSTSVEADVLLASRRRCCLCWGLRRDLDIKQGQLAHINRDPSDSSAENLAFMCLEHHDWFDTKTSQSKGATIEEARRYREELYNELRRRDEAEAGIVATSAAAPAIAQAPARAPFQPIFADDERLNIRWVIRVEPARWVDKNLKVFTPRSLHEILDGPLHSWPGCLERLAEHHGPHGLPAVLFPRCPGCGTELFVWITSLPLEYRYATLLEVREQALAELQRMHRTGITLEGPRVVLHAPRYWGKMRAVGDRA